MPPPRKKRPPAGQPVPGAGTISAHRDALRRSSGAAGQKPPERGLKNSPGRGGLGDLHPMGEWQAMGCLVPESDRPGCPPGQRACLGTKNSPQRRPEAVCRLRHRGRAAMGCLVPGRRRTGRTPGQRARPGAKTAPGGAGGCLDAGYGCYLPRAIRVIWMHRVGSTARPRIMPS